MRIWCIPTILLATRALVGCAQGQLASSATAMGQCRAGQGVIVQVRSLADLPPGLSQQATTFMRAADARDSQRATLFEPYAAPDVSRTLGASMRSVSAPAPVSGPIDVRYVGAQGEPTLEIGTFYLWRGTVTFRFPDNPHGQWAEIVFPDYLADSMGRPVPVISPTISGGAHILRISPEELGRWCLPYVHALVP